MKPLILVVACVIGFPLLSRTQSDQMQTKAVQYYDLGSQPGATATFNALSVEQEPHWIRLKGKAEVTTGAAVFRADEIDYNTDSGQTDARGDIHINLLPLPLVMVR